MPGMLHSNNHSHLGSSSAASVAACARPSLILTSSRPAAEQSAVTPCNPTALLQGHSVHLQPRRATAVASKVVVNSPPSHLQQEEPQQHIEPQQQPLLQLQHVLGAAADAGQLAVGDMAVLHQGISPCISSGDNSSSSSSIAPRGSSTVPTRARHRALRRHAAEADVAEQQHQQQQEEAQESLQQQASMQVGDHAEHTQQQQYSAMQQLHHDSARQHKQWLQQQQLQHEQLQLQQQHAGQAGLQPLAEQLVHQQPVLLHEHHEQLQQQSLLVQHPSLLPRQAAAAAVVDPSALAISDRVRLLASNAAARRQSSSSRRGTHARAAAVDLMAVLQQCSCADLSGAATNSIISHVKNKKVGTAPETLRPFLAAYQRMSDAYGEPVVLKWLQKAPPIIRAEAEVPARLDQLRDLLGASAPLSEVLALTKRCPQVLQVSRTVVVTRMQQLCSMLGRDPKSEARTLLIAGPALLAMQPHTLAVKLQQLQALAATHPSWSAAHSSCPSKTLAILLTYSLERQLRLHYLAAHGLQDKIQMNTAMAWSKRDWLKAHPTFDDWCQTYKRLQQAQLKQQQQQQQQPPPLHLPPLPLQQQRVVV